MNRIGSLALVATSSLVAVGCAPAAPTNNGPSSSTETSSCSPCVANSDCPTTEECGELPGTSFCVAGCSDNADCGSGQICFNITNVSGKATGACVNLSGACSPNPSGSNDAGNVTDSGAGNMDAGTVNPVDSGTPPFDAGTTVPHDAGTTPFDAGTEFLDSGSTEPPDGGNVSPCEGYATPNETGGSCPCQAGHTCSANNCYGGYYCDLTTNTCVAPPTNCSSPSDAGNPPPQDAGSTTPDAGRVHRDAGNPTPDAGSTNPGDAGPFSSNVTASGGSESQLFFAVIGDTRPYNGDDTANYPATPPLPACTTSNDTVGTDTASCGAINKIYQDIQAFTPRPPFVISTGDYQYVTPGMGDSTTQLGYYQTARALYGGVEWPAMGNHECDGYTASECAPNGTPICPSGDTCSGATTENLLNYEKLFLMPIGETLPYYTRTVTAADESWTAHFIFVAPNYWNSTQASWFTAQLTAAGTSSTSNYIFVIHHEDATAGAPTSLSTIESAEQNIETVSIVGHSHTWAHGGSNPKELLVGNGGVPSTSDRNLGFTTVTRQPNGQLVINNYDFMTQAVVDTYTVTP